MTWLISTLAFITVLPWVAPLRPVDWSPCYRSCELPSIPMTCQFNWTLDWFYTMADKLCGNCPFTASDCNNTQCIPVDGFSRAVSVMNRVFPAPSIQICSGDEVVVNVVNQMSNNEGTSIHWHGIFMNGSQYMDGLPMVTQCPIPSPGKFQYRFTPYEPGTHWFHSHSGLQRGDGLMGSFIIRESSRTDPQWGLYDEDRAEDVVFLNDWYHDTLVSVFETNTWGNHSIDVSTILINGKGVTEGGSFPHPPVEVFNVRKDVRYRFRVISGAASFCNMQFSVEGHSLLMIASDGGSFQPVAVDYFRISSGERYDFVLTANQSIANYQIRVVGLPCTNANGGPTRQVAYLHYEGANEVLASEVTLPDIEQIGDKNTWWQAFPNRSLAEIYAVDPDYRTTLKADEAEPYYLQVDFEDHIDPSTKMTRSYPQINNITFQFPTSPLLSQYRDVPASSFCNESTFGLGECDGDELCSCVHTIELKLNQQIEIILVNPQANFSVLHPMHLHGMQYKIVAMDKIEDASIARIKELDRLGQIKRNNGGPNKDVVIIPNGGYTIFQIHAWNPGWWIFHCHIEFHLEEGMALLFHVGEPSDLPPIPRAFPTCGVWPPEEIDSAEPPDSCPSTAIYPADLIHLIWIIPVALVIGAVVGVVSVKCIPRVTGSSPGRSRATLAASPTVDTSM